MTDQEAKILTDKVFGFIQSASCPEQITMFISEHLSSHRMDPETYPPLQLQLDKEEIRQLEHDGLLDARGNLSLQLSRRADLNPLSKLLYAVLWKNGDLKKIRHIVEGIKEAENKKLTREQGIVFYQFGRFLAGKGEPIIDQHVFRAFAVYRARYLEEVAFFRKKSNVTKDDLALIMLYKSWLKSDELSESLKDQDDYTWHVDQLLFALGKAIKQNRNPK